MGARERRDETPEKRAEREAKLAEAVKTVLTCIGEDPNREGLLKTPDRYAKALMFFTQGYERNIHGKLEKKRRTVYCKRKLNSALSLCVQRS